MPERFLKPSPAHEMQIHQLIPKRGDDKPEGKFASWFTLGRKIFRTRFSADAAFKLLKGTDGSDYKNFVVGGERAFRRRRN